MSAAPVSAARMLRAARHPVRTGRRALHRLAGTGPGLPVGRTAAARRLLRRCLGDQQRLLVVGPVHVVRQALPAAALDLVGTNPKDLAITVVSTADAEGSLPRRWNCVVVTDVDPSPGRLAAAAGACLPDGVIALLTSRGRRGLQLELVRPAA